MNKRDGFIITGDVVKSEVVSPPKDDIKPDTLPERIPVAGPTRGLLPKDVKKDTENGDSST